MFCSFLSCQAMLLGYQAIAGNTGTTQNKESVWALKSDFRLKGNRRLLGLISSLFCATVWMWVMMGWYLSPGLWTLRKQDQQRAPRSFWSEQRRARGSTKQKSNTNSIRSTVVKSTEQIKGRRRWKETKKRWTRSKLFALQLVVIYSLP